MKVWLAVVLSTSVVLTAAAAVIDEGAQVSTEVVKAEVPSSTQVLTGTEEDPDATEPSLKATIGEKSDLTKDKSEKEKDDGEQEKDENEENENEEGENEEEESDEGESDEEDSEESEGKGSSNKKNAKVESEEENNNNEKADVFKIPSVVRSRSMPVDSSVAIQSYKPMKSSRSGYGTLQSEYLFSPDQSFHATTKVHNPKFDVEISTQKPYVQFPFRARPDDPTEPLDDADHVFRSAGLHQTESRKAHHPKWFFNTPNGKSSDDLSIKKESSKSFLPELPISKPAVAKLPAWPITNTRPAVRESYKPAVSQSEYGNSHPKWFFNAARASLDGSNKKESSQPVDIDIPAHKSAAVQTRPWSKPVISSPIAPPTIGLPIYKTTDSSQPSTRKVYPRWFFNIKN